MEEIKLQQFKEKLELRGYSKRAINDYPSSVRLFFTYLEKEENVHTVSDILPEHITGYHSHLQYNKLNRDDSYLSSVTIRCRLQIVKTFYQIMFEEKLIEHDYAPLIKLPKRKMSLPKHVPSEKDMKLLLESIQPTDPIRVRDRTMLELLYATAIRNEELRTITCDNLDLHEKTVLICGKGSKERVVPIGEWVLPWLREYLEVSRKKLINKNKQTDLLFISKNGRQLTEGNMCDLMRKYVKRSGLDYRITPHSFRHACATHLLKAGADIRYVQELLGHSDLSSTQIYTKLDIGFLKKAHKQYHPREKQDNED